MAGKARKSTHAKKASAKALATRRSASKPSASKPKQKRVEIDETVSNRGCLLLFLISTVRHNRILVVIFTYDIFRSTMRSPKLVQFIWNGAKKEPRMLKANLSRNITSKKTANTAFG